MTLADTALTSRCSILLYTVYVCHGQIIALQIFGAELSSGFSEGGPGLKPLKSKYLRK